MATALKNYLTSSIGTSLTSVYLPTAVNIQCTVIGFTIANITNNTITANVLITSGDTTVYIVKNATITPGTSLDLMGASKFIVEQNDNVQVQSNTVNSADVLVSVVEVS